jgi:prolyl 4-hydroxylase
MKKIGLDSGTKNPNFIGSWTIEPISICDDLISYFELNIPKQKKGATAGGINLDTKNSVDITIKPKEIILPGNEVFKLYFDQLLECYKNYVEDWTFLNQISERL